MGKAILFIALVIAFCWIVSKLINALPDLFLFMYQFSGSMFLLLGGLYWATTDYSSGKGGVLLLQIFTLMPFYILFLAKMANLRANNKGGAQAKLFRGGMLSMSTVFFPIGMLARKMAALDSKQKAAEKPAAKETD